MNFTCTFHKRCPAFRMKSKGSLSPRGFDTPNPKLEALKQNASSASSPKALGVRLRINSSPLSSPASAKMSPTLQLVNQGREEVTDIGALSRTKVGTTVRTVRVTTQFVRKLYSSGMQTAEVKPHFGTETQAPPLRKEGNSKEHEWVDTAPA